MKQNDTFFCYNLNIIQVITGGLYQIYKTKPEGMISLSLVTPLPSFPETGKGRDQTRSHCMKTIIYVTKILSSHLEYSFITFKTRYFTTQNKSSICTVGPQNKASYRLVYKFCNVHQGKCIIKVYGHTYMIIIAAKKTIVCVLFGEPIIECK